MDRRRWLLLCLVLLGSTFGLKGQAFFDPSVTINSYGLQQVAQRDLAKLQEQIQQMLELYRPDANLRYSPKRPIRIVVYLHVQEVIGNQYKGDMEMALYRPVYGVNREEPLVFFSEQSLAFQYRPEVTYDFLSGGLPESMLARILYYYATLGAMYYYDSFELKGGEPFLTYLNEHMQYLGAAWNRPNGAVSVESSRYAPLVFLQEHKTSSGERFRELWYLYHRQGVDGSTSSAYGTTVKEVLEGLLQLRENNNSLPFIPLFYTAKSGAISQFLRQTDLPIATEVSRLMERLFPTFSFIK